MSSDVRLELADDFTVIETLFIGVFGELNENLLLLYVIEFLVLLRALPRLPLLVAAVRNEVHCCSCGEVAAIQIVVGRFIRVVLLQRVALRSMKSELAATTCSALLVRVLHALG